MHKTIKKTSMGVAALAALALGGSQIANATSGGDDTETNDDGPALTGAPSTKAGEAATTALGGGRVVSVEKTDEGGKAVYEVKVSKAGKVTEVQLAGDYGVVSEQPDDEATDEGDGEQADDAKGDGDGERNDD